MFPYKKTLVLGATSGIGLALAERIISATDSHVIVAGRRQEKLDEFVKKHGKDRASAEQVDLLDLKSLPEFVERVKDIDCIILNSGIQRGLDFTKPESIDLDSVSDEFNTNYLAYVHLLKVLLPHFAERNAALVFVTSCLALVPLYRCPNYCASKAAMHQLIMVLRSQLASNIKIMEILPPSVQTELHDAKHQPDIKDGRSIGMPLDEFTDKAWKGLERGDEHIPVGLAEEQWNALEKTRAELYDKMNEQMTPGWKEKK